MFKKLITLMMVLSIFTVNANAASNSGLKAAFDELNYSLNVEWDQKDLNFKTEQMKKFSATVRDLQAKGLTNDQMIAFVKTQVDAKAARDLDTAFSMISINKMSSVEASKYMIEVMNKSYSNGASWNGNAGTSLIVAVLLIAVVVAVVAGGGHVAVYNNGGYCDYNYYQCAPYYDAYGYYYDNCYYGTYCY